MKQIYLTSVLLVTLLASHVFAQDPASLQRLDLDTTLAPFYHGVASGDPLHDAIIIWTRVTVEDTSATTVDVYWEMSTDTCFATLVDSGTVSTGVAKDFTVKVDVTDLQPGSYYYYRFKYEGHYSVTGRTKTAPDQMVDQLRFAVVSCADYKNGYYNAYQHVRDRNDLDAVIHLGDYIYEYATSSSTTRPHVPATEIVTLSDYRSRFSHYKLDEQLRGLHQQYPFITIWDDHETANNSWYGGAENHTQGAEGDWFDRKANGMTAYFEWMPIRDPSGSNPFKGYRKVNYGGLADILVLDTRLEGRDEQTSNSSTINDTARTLISTTQMNWLLNELSDTTTQWKIIAQQVMMAPLKLAGTPVNNDQWDGYEADRQRIFDHILNNNIEDVVVLTGDIHTGWAIDLKDGNTNVAVEFVATSITSSSSSFSISQSIVTSLFPHVKYAELAKKGYYILDVTPARTQADFYFVNTIDEVDPTGYHETSWYVNAGDRSLSSGTETSIIEPMPPFAPSFPVQCAADTVIDTTTSIAKLNTELVIVGAYPNPFQTELAVQYYSEQGRDIHVELLDMTGKLVISRDVNADKGVNYTKIDGSALPSGQYLLLLNDGKNIYRRRVAKTQ